jgi:hypothetical protein
MGVLSRRTSYGITSGRHACRQFAILILSLCRSDPPNLSWRDGTGSDRLYVSSAMPSRGHSTRIVLPDSIASLSIASHARYDADGRSLIDSSHRVEALAKHTRHSYSPKSQPRALQPPRQATSPGGSCRAVLSGTGAEKSPADAPLKHFEPKLSSVSRPKGMRKAGTTAPRSHHCLASVNCSRVAVCGSLEPTSARESPLVPFWYRYSMPPCVKQHRAGTE